MDYKTGGNQKEFAALLGWSPQYLHKMLKGDSMGIQPVTTLLQRFPELNARWLILGEGVMLNQIRGRIFDLLSLERYIPVMSREETAALASGQTDFDSDTVERWKAHLAQKQEKIRARFDAAYEKQRDNADENESDYREAVL